MKVRYIYSACVVIETLDVVLCCDPWFTPGAYDGSWYQYPPLEDDPVNVIGPVDHIYISHIHPDHYDVRFLKRYLARYPETGLFIGKTEPPFLLKRMQTDGFKPKVLTEAKFGQTEVHVISNGAYDEIENIDTALVVRQDSLSVVNINDNPFDPKQVEKILSCLPSGNRPTLALLPYNGAGPFPQTYEFPSESELAKAAERKKKQFLDLYTRYIEALKPLRAMPFAGKYYLGGPLSSLNEIRGIADATEVLSRHGDISFVLADGGKAYFELDDLSVHGGTRVRAYDYQDIRHYLAGMSFKGYDYEKEIVPLEGRSLPLLPLIQKAYVNAIHRRAVEEPIWICIKPSTWDRYLTFDASSDSGVKVMEDVSSLNPRHEIFIDQRYLFGLMTHLYHWDNAAIGSHFRVRRVPDIFRRDLHAFLCRLHV